MKRFRRVFEESRGRGLPGNPGSSLVDNLFRKQSQRWRTIAWDYLNKMIGLCHRFVRQSLRDACDHDITGALLQLNVDNDLQARQQKAHDELNKLLKDHEKYVLTLNPHFAASAHHHRTLGRKPKELPANTGNEKGTSPNSAHNPNQPQNLSLPQAPNSIPVQVDLDKQALELAIESMLSFYEVYIPQAVTIYFLTINS